MYRPLLNIFVFFGLGIIVQTFVPLPFALLILLHAGCIVLSLTFLKQRKQSSIFLFISFFLLGLVFTKSYLTLSANDISRIARYYQGTTVSMEGIVDSDVEVRDFFKGKKTSFHLDVKRFKTKWGWRRKEGRVLVNIFNTRDVNYGDYVFLEGKMHAPFNFKSDGKFSYRRYLNHRGIRYILSVKRDGPIKILSHKKANPVKYWSIQVKNQLKGVLTKHLTKNESGIMQAILLGDRTNIPKHIRELFVRTGTAHILAISGLHIGIVTALILMFLKLLPLRRKPIYLLTIVFLIGYAFLTGGRASVIRATIMATILLSGVLMERETNALNSLAFAALVILGMNPLNMFDVSFQLSFLSVLCIICFYQKLIDVFSKIPRYDESKAVTFMVQSMTVSLSAWLGVMGVIAYYFHIVTPVTILANLVIIPLIGVVVALGLGLLMVGIVLPAGAFAFAFCLKISLNVMIVSIYLFDQFPFGHIYLKDVSLWSVMCYYAIIGIIFLGGTIAEYIKKARLAIRPSQIDKMNQL